MDATVDIDQWIRFVFDHPVTDVAWHFAANSPYLILPPERAAQLIAESFERSGELLRPFTDAQLNQGFWFLVSHANSDYMFCLTNASVAWPVRQRALRSFVPLFCDVMAVRCTDSLASLSEPGSPLNSTCFMWWDLLPLDASWKDGQPPQPIHVEALTVLAEILELPHDACRESALHGLGHLALFHREAVPIIDAFIERAPNLRPELLAYAKQARTGHIL